MTNRAKQKGTSFESLIVAYLQERGFDAERQVLHGNKDEGDIRIRIPGTTGLNLECKNVRGLSVPGAVDEATVEAANAGRPCVVVHKRIGKGAGGEQLVSMKLSQLLDWFVAGSSESADPQSGQ